jgi:hypothetical protein
MPPKNSINANTGLSSMANRTATTMTATNASAAKQTASTQDVRTIRGVQYAPISRKSLRDLFRRRRRRLCCDGTGVATGRAVGSGNGAAIGGNGAAVGGGKGAAMFGPAAKASIARSSTDGAGDAAGIVVETADSETTGGGAGGRFFVGARISRCRVAKPTGDVGHVPESSGTSTRAWQCGQGDDSPALRASTSNPLPHELQVTEIVAMTHRTQERYQRNPMNRAEQQRPCLSS